MPEESTALIERPIESLAINEHSTSSSNPEDVRRNKQWDDEYNNHDLPILQPLRSVIIGEGKFNFDLQIQNDLAHLSRTRKLEENTPRTQILQQIANQMTANTGIETRIVIMNKGLEPAAFVYPDGTIFISQSLLNALTTMDEVGGVIAHEVGHLLNHTFEKKAQASQDTSLGIGWIHEAAADQTAPILLEKAGLNSWGLSNAIVKLSGPNRGSIHQTGIARASEVTAAHAARHYDTSNQPETPLEPQFGILKQETKPTNQEVLKEIMDQRDYASFAAIIADLHPKDLYSLMSDRYWLNTGVHEYADDFLKLAGELVKDRFRSGGYTELETATFLLGLNGPRTPNFIPDRETVIQIANYLTSQQNLNKLYKMYYELFSTKYLPSSVKATPTIAFVVNLNADKDTSTPPHPYKIPISEDSLIKALTISATNPIDNKDSKAYIRTLISRTLADYAYDEYVKGKEPTLENEQALREFLIKVKNTSLYISPMTYERMDSFFPKVFKEVFEIKEETYDLAKIDGFFEGLSLPGGRLGSKDRYRGFIEDLHQYLKKNRLPDSERLKYLEYINQRIDQLPDINLGKSLLAFLNGTSLENAELKPGEEELNNRLAKFNLKLTSAVVLFEKDGDEFYSYLKQITSELDIPPDALSSTQIINLFRSLLGNDAYGSEGTACLFYGFSKKYEPSYTENIYSFYDMVNIKNFNQLSSLPYINLLLRRSDSATANSFSELNALIKDRVKRTSWGYSNNLGTDIYAESLYSLIIGRGIREEANRLLSEGVPESDYEALYEFINHYYPTGEQKSLITREISQRLLSTQTIDFPQKINYLVEHFDEVGPEGMMILANQITTLDNYLAFRDRMSDRLSKYLEGSNLTTKLATGDVVTSMLPNKFEDLFATCSDDELSQEQNSTQLAVKWFNACFSSIYKEIDYNTQTKQVVVQNSSRAFFRSFKDSVGFLKNLSSFQKFGIAMKALTDKGGALTNQTNRETLGEILNKSLATKPGFINSAIKWAVRKADAEIASIPVSRMLSKLLFRGINADAVNLDTFNKGRSDFGSILTQSVPDEDIPRLLYSDTRTLLSFGRDFAKFPNSLITQLANQSNSEYLTSLGLMDNSFINSGQLSENADQLVDPSTEAVISGVEASGALGVRSLQLARQLYSFPPDIDRRLAQCFDTNPGLNKLLFWENLVVLSERDSRLKKYLENKLVSLDGYLGGGSLYTTFAAKVRTPDGSVKEEVLKMLNPNSEAFIGKSYKIARETLEAVLEDKTPELGETRQSNIAKRRQAELGLLLINLSQNWCLKDINDHTFVQDDNNFRQTIESFNQSFGRNIFYAPELDFTSPRLKSESQAPGVTLNKFLNDETVDPAIKRQAVETFAKFFVHQLENRPFVDENSKPYLLVHSDPHPGNYIIAASDEGIDTMAVIDRNLYLKLSPEDMKSLEPLIREKGNLAFVLSFVGRLMNINKDRGFIEKVKIFNRFARSTISKFGRQILDGEVDNVILLRNLFETLVNEKMNVPLELQLMIKNIESVKELMRRHNLKLEDYYSFNRQQPLLTGELNYLDPTLLSLFSGETK